MIRLALPNQGIGRPARDQDFIQEAVGHHRIARRRMLGAQRFDLGPPRPLAEDAMNDDAMTIGVMEHRRPRRNVGIDHGVAARVLHPLGQGRHLQRAAARLFQPITERGRADAQHLEPAVFLQRHGVAFQPMTGGIAAGGDGGGIGPGGRGEHAAVVGEKPEPVLQPPQVGRPLGIDQVGAQAITDDQYGAFLIRHGGLCLLSKN